MKLGLQGIHEDIVGMCVSSKMGQRSVYLEAASKINDHGRQSTKELASFHTNVAKVLYVSKRPTLDTSLDF